MTLVCFGCFFCRRKCVWVIASFPFAFSEALKGRTHFTLAFVSPPLHRKFSTGSMFDFRLRFIRPSSQVRFIKEVPVFAVTATFSVLAYLWLLIIVSWSCGVVGLGRNGSFSRIFESQKTDSPNHRSSIANIPGLPCFWGLQFQDYNVN